MAVMTEVFFSAASSCTPPPSPPSSPPSSPARWTVTCLTRFRTETGSPRLAWVHSSLSFVGEKQYQLNTPILPPKELGCLMAVSQLGGDSISLEAQLDTVSTHRTTRPLLSLHIVDCSTQLTLIFMIWQLHLSVFHNKYQSCKYAQHSREICYIACTHMNTCSLFAVCLSWSLVFCAWIRESRTSSQGAKECLQLC